MKKLFLSTVVVVVAICLGTIFTYMNRKAPEIPELDLQKWWGNAVRPEKENDSIRPFKIDFNNTMIQDLKQRLKSRRRLTKPLEGIQSEYGMNTDYLEKILTYWVDKYDFKKRAELLNRFPHYKTRIRRWSQPCGRPRACPARHLYKTVVTALRAPTSVPRASLV